MQVGQLMTARIAECAPQDSIRAAARRMREVACGCLPVTSEDGGRKRLVGFITDRDLVCRVLAEGLDPDRTEVGRCMSVPVHTIRRDADLGDCADRFAAIGVRRLVVVDDQERCLGVISRADFHRYVAETVAREPARPAAAEDDAFAIAPRRDDPELTL
jgi:CBS domain-containing protein